MDGSACAQGSAAGAPASIAVRVPGPGEWKARAWAADAVRSGAKGPWSAPLRLRRRSPGSGRGRRRRALVDGRRLRARRAEPAGDGAERARPASPATRSPAAAVDPGTTITDRGERALVDLGDLPEGVTTIRARAISGAGVAATAAGEGLVRIDRTPPSVVLTTDGAPLIASGGRVARRGRAPARPGLRPGAPLGDDAGARGEAVTSGAYLEYQVDDAPPVRVRTPSVTVDLPDDGLHVVTVRAVDAAGNMSDPQRATFRVDRNPPSGNVERIDRDSSRGACARASPRSASTGRCARASPDRRPRLADATPRRPSAAPSRGRPRRPAPGRRLHGAVPRPRLRRQHRPHLHGSAVDPVALRLPLRDASTSPRA